MIPIRLQLAELTCSWTNSYGMILWETAIIINTNNKKQSKYINRMFRLMNTLFNSYNKASATTIEIGISINQIKLLLISGLVYEVAINTKAIMLKIPLYNITNSFTEKRCTSCTIIFRLFWCSLEGNDNKINNELIKEMKTPQYIKHLACAVTSKYFVASKVIKVPIPHAKIANLNQLITLMFLDFAVFVLSCKYVKWQMQ